MGVLGALGILTFAAFVNQIAHWLGIPTWWGYGLAVLGGIIILLLNLGVQNLSRVIYRWLVTGLLTIMAIQTVIVCL
ncbi:MAG: hypothetical protein FWF25_07700, partial [Propionibacteriaceae bacterium]|nr:hypothetical protein [Propionibacteriaceae bacterium]